MTTLQELVDEFMDVLEETIIDGGYTIPKTDDDSWLNRDDAENRLISFIEKAYLAGKEDEKKRTAGEIMKIKKQILKSLSRHPNWTYEDIEADIDEEVEKFTEEIPLFEGTLKQLEDLKQSIIK
jgi:hypothetical protein